MAKNQDAMRRYRVILRALNTRGKLSTKQLLDTCLNSGINVSSRTIQKDLNALKEDHDLFGRDLTLRIDTFSKKWFCENLPKEIFTNLELDKEEIGALLFHAKIANQYKDYPIFTAISTAIDKVLESSNLSKNLKRLFEEETWLETEKHSLLDGTEYIMTILEALHKRNTLFMKYRKFHGDILKEYEISPLVLKEDKQMWYVIGKNLKSNKIITFALDRIVSLEATDSQFDKIQFDSKTYFKHAFGITVTDNKPEEIIISFSHYQGNYIRTLPIHSSQEILIDNESELRVKITVEPTYEFYAKIKSYADQAIILSPQHVAEKVKNSFRNALNIYDQHNV